MTGQYGRVALIAETTMTFDEVRLKGNAVAVALKEAGIRPGDFVAIATSNRASFYCCFAGCFAAGFPVVVLDPGAAVTELMLMLQRALPAALIADVSILQGLVQQQSATLPKLTLQVGAGEKSTSTSGSLKALLKGRLTSSTWPSIEQLPAARSAELENSPDDALPAYVMFTSGTTSIPKATVISRAALRHHVATLSKVFGYGDNSTLLSYFPTHHTDGLVHGVAASLLTGMTVVQPGAFTQTTDLEFALTTNKVSHLLVVPTMLAMLQRMYADRPELFRYDGFQHLISTAGYLDEKLWRSTENLFGIRVSNFYGMTETVSGSLYCGPDDHTYQIGTLGKPVDAEIRIVSEDGGAVPVNTIGELQISGKHLMSGYLGDPVATEAVHKDGWLSTGDLFTQDEQGVLRFSGRVKNIIKRGGITVYPEDIRRIVAGIDGILEVEVIGLPDDMFEEIIAVAAVVDKGITVDTIRASCREFLAAERQPDLVVLLDELPYGPSGKVQRQKLIAALQHRLVCAQEDSHSVRDRVIRVAANTFAN